VTWTPLPFTTSSMRPPVSSAPARSYKDSRLTDLVFGPTPAC
jgi:hypothetical protein